MLSSLFVPLLIDFSIHTAEQQAHLILKILHDYHQQGYTQIGLTYSANHEQTLAIFQTYQSAQWQTHTSGGNQAWVIALIEQALSQSPYQALQSVFRILPITTCAYGGGIGAVEPQWLEQELNHISTFLTEPNRVILGWQNQLSIQNPQAPFAVGGGISQQLKPDQNAAIQACLLDLQMTYSN